MSHFRRIVWLLKRAWADEAVRHVALLMGNFLLMSSALMVGIAWSVYIYTYLMGYVDSAAYEYKAAIVTTKMLGPVILVALGLIRPLTRLRIAYEEAHRDEDET